MYVRAPKHFKSGKQHIFFFRGVYTNKYTLTHDKCFALMHELNENTIFSLVTTSLTKATYVDCLLSRVTIKQPVLLNIK